MLNLAILSYWHVHAKDYEREALANPNSTITVIWDEDAERGQEQADRIGARFEADVDSVLTDPGIDGVIVTTATSDHFRVIGAAACAGKHIFTEKVLTLRVDEAFRVLEMVRNAGVTMMVCLPRLSNGYVQAIKALIDSDELGEIRYFRMRVGHNGAVRTESDPEGWLPPHFFNLEEAGGGALIDLGAHPLYVARYLLGLPEKIYASYSYATRRGVEDHAVVTLEYGGGLIGVAEVSFVDQPSTFDLEVQGERGIVRIEQPDMELRIRRARKNRREPTEWEVLPVPSDLASPFDQWIALIQAGETSAENLELAFDLTCMADAANRSNETNSSRFVEDGEVRDQRGQIGQKQRCGERFDPV